MRKIAALGTALVAAAMTAGTALAQTTPTGPDYSSLTEAVDFSSTTTAILAVGALAVGLTLVTVGIRKICGWFAAPKRCSHWGTGSRWSPFAAGVPMPAQVGLDLFVMLLGVAVAMAAILGIRSGM